MPFSVCDPCAACYFAEQTEFHLNGGSGDVRCEQTLASGANRETGALAPRTRSRARSAGMSSLSSLSVWRPHGKHTSAAGDDVAGHGP
jgi:hypothetical protein